MRLFAFRKQSGGAHLLWTCDYPGANVEKPPTVTDETRHYLIRQFETAWKLTSFHLESLTTRECLWHPARTGLHVHQAADGR